MAKSISPAKSIAPSRCAIFGRATARSSTSAFSPITTRSTGLPNRSSFNKRLDREIELAMSSAGKLAILCLDIDRFKEVNDLFGHAAGDKMLQSVAARIASTLDSDQMVARLSGDEFAISLYRVCRTPLPAGRSPKSLWRP